MSRALASAGCALALALCATTATAHSGKTHIDGTITAIEAKQIVVKKENGRSISVRVNRDTTYQRFESAAPATAADLRVGCGVRIESFGMPGAEQTALEVHFSAPAGVEERGERGGGGEHGLPAGDAQ